MEKKKKALSKRKHSKKHSWVSFTSYEVRPLELQVHSTSRFGLETEPCGNPS